MLIYKSKAVEGIVGGLSMAVENNDPYECTVTPGFQVHTYICVTIRASVLSHSWCAAFDVIMQSQSRAVTLQPRQVGRMTLSLSSLISDQGSACCLSGDQGIEMP